MPSPQNNLAPTIFVILGITGDLAAKKIIPALYNLYVAGHLPQQFQVIGFGRRSWSDDELRAYVKEVMVRHEYKGETAQAFCRLFFYHYGLFEKEREYHELAARFGRVDGEWQACSNKLFYLSVPPEQYEIILEHLHASGLTVPCSDQTGWTRVLLEKPFGGDEATAERLDRRLAQLFDERQIYRIDHYLAKEMLQNIVTFRFGNDLFEHIWNGRHIERIEVRLWETLGVESRGAFYDTVGALRDVGQNHLLQMVALVTMARPREMTAEAIRAARASVLNTLVIPIVAEASRRSYRGQYIGYNTIQGVAADSRVETFFRVHFGFSHPDWRGVAFMMEGGKRLGEAKKEIVVMFRHEEPCLCRPGEAHHQNRVVFQFEPEENVVVDFAMKTPGLAVQRASRAARLTLRDDLARKQYVEEYEQLIADAVRGDQTLFVSTAEIKAMWRFIDPVRLAWEQSSEVPVRYAADTNEAIAQADQFFAGPFSKARSREIGFIGLGKMGFGLASRLAGRGWRVVGYDSNRKQVDEVAAQGVAAVTMLPELVAKLASPRCLWLMVPAAAVDDVLKQVSPLLSAGDIIIDGGNSFYRDTIRRAKEFAAEGIHYVDVGVSGGPGGARIGPALMIGGVKEDFETLEPLFQALARPLGYQFFPGAGAGHFVKMVHNGIEYGMMQALAEGFEILKISDYALDVKEVARIYNSGSVIESRLVEWLSDAFVLHGADLSSVSSTVAHTGEGAWTVETAEALKVKTAVIAAALEFRKQSEANPSYAGKVLSALREQFGGHGVHVSKNLE